MSIKIKTSWTDSNVIIEGVRIYKSSVNFDVSSRPAVYAEILDGSEFYEDLNVAEGQTYFYMLSCFLGEQEVFTECYEVKAELALWLSTSFFMLNSVNRANNYHLLQSSASASNFGISLASTAQYYGANIASNGKLYFIPRSAGTILVIDIASGTAIKTSMGLSLIESWAYVGGVLGSDGKIYCIPYGSTDILIIDPATQTATRSNMGVNLSGTNKWIGGVLGSDGKIYAAPYSSSSVLIIKMNDLVSTPPIKYCLSPHINKF